MSGAMSAMIQGTASAPPVLWTPADYTGGVLVSWHDPSDAANVTVVLGKVAVDSDLSGNGYHDTQVTGANQPAYTTGVLNGLAIEDFANTGSPAFFETTLPGDPAVQTWMCLLKWDSNDDTVWGAVNNGGIQLYITSGGNIGLLKQFFVGIGESTGNLVTSGNWNLIVCSYDNGSGAYSFRVNGTPCGSGTNAQSLVGGNARFGIGPSGSSPFTGLISERATLNVTTTSETRAARTSPPLLTSEQGTVK